MVYEHKMNFGSLVLSRLEELGENVNSFEAKHGWTQGYLRAVVRTDNKKTNPNIDRARQIAEALGLEFYIGPPREPVVTTLIDPADGPDYALVPSYPVEASAGAGATAVDVAPDGALAFRKDWLSKHGISLDNATLLRARGDSMEPVIWDGDLLLVDRSRKTINVSSKKTRKKAVYVVELEGQLLVKTLRRPTEDRLFLISENVADYDPMELRNHEINALRIIGKVVWWGHTVG